MKVYQDLSTLPPITNAVLTIGTFDGVHLGHQQIIRQLIETARMVNGETVILTFHPHPRKIISSGAGELKLLNTPEEKIHLLELEGIDHLVIIPFNDSFASQSASSYIKDFLWAYFKPHTIIIGYDHRFGKGREGDFRLLETYAATLGFKVKEIPEQILQESIISSTRIRKSLAEHDIATANAFLGYAYFFEGLVVKGNQLGRTIGYPTANIQMENNEKLLPGDGVYAVKMAFSSPGHEGETASGMMNIGVRPTVDGSKRVIEVNIFDFDRDIYHETLKVSVIQYIRGEVKFNGLEALKQQLMLDRIAVQALLD